MGKINSPQDIPVLIARSMSGQLDQQEKEILESWLHSSQKNQELHDKIVSEKNFSAHSKIYESIDTDKAWARIELNSGTSKKGKTINIFLRYAAGILLPVMIAISSYWYLNRQPTAPTHPIATISAGNKSAVLVLGNGKNVDLTHELNKKIVEKDGTVINNSHTELNYAGQPSAIQEETPSNTLIVPCGGEYSLVLSDGSRVYLNSMSKLVFPVRFSGKNREVTLEGEAFFEVAKDKSKPFIVSIRGMKVEVLGTSFDIKSYPNDSQSFTTLVEGKVKISSGDQLANVNYLEPNQQAVYDPAGSGIVIHEVDAAQMVQWTKGRVTFTNQTLDEIMKTLARWYDFSYKFEDEKLKSIRFEGGFNKYESIDPILDIISRTGKVKVSVKGKEILFSRI